MQYSEVLKMVQSLGDEVEVFEFEREMPVIDVTINDFSGFDENQCEIIRDHDSNAVSNVINWLENNALSVKGDYYIDYCFNGFRVHLGYASYDI